MAELNELRERIEYLEKQNISLIEYINKTSQRVNLVTDIVWSNKDMNSYLDDKDSWSWIEYPSELIGPTCVVTDFHGRAKVGRFDEQGDTTAKKQQNELIKILKPFEPSLPAKKSKTIETFIGNDKHLTAEKQNKSKCVKKKLLKQQKKLEKINKRNNSKCEMLGVIDSIESPTNATHTPIATEIIPVLTVPTAPPKPPRKKISC
tara:strand:+ start:1748 stop:2362 length:615 start_codon:yes stop_codon:yes gene_type:complete